MTSKTGNTAAPPHNLEAESSALGAVLLADAWMDSLVGELGIVETNFYRQAHRLIWRSMLALYTAGEPIDTLTVAARLDSTGDLVECGGAEYVETLVERIPSLANTRQYAQIVKDTAKERALLRAAQIIQETAHGEGAIDDRLDSAQSMIAEIAADETSRGLIPLGDAMHDELRRIEDAGNRTETLTGVTSGLVDLDEITHGFQSGKVIVIGARPSMGKSALAATIARAAALAGHPVALFTMEMDQSEVSQRLLAQQSRLPGERLKTGEIEPTAWPRLHEAGAAIESWPILIDDDASQTVTAIRSKVRRQIARRASRGQRPLELVVIDYLQLIRVEDPRAQRTYQVEEQMRALKRMARDLNIPVIVLSQLSREVERRSPPIPQLADLKDSGAIEQDADVVILIYREDYYRSDSERPGEADLIVAKQRGGKTGTVPVGFVAHYPAFIDLKLDAKPTEKPSAAFVLGRDDPEEDFEF